MSVNELTRMLKALAPEQRELVESIIALLAKRPPLKKQRDLTGHPSFGAWSDRKDLTSVSDAAVRAVRKRTTARASRRNHHDRTN